MHTDTPRVQYGRQKASRIVRLFFVCLCAASVICACRTAPVQPAPMEAGVYVDVHIPEAARAHMRPISQLAPAQGAWQWERLSYGMELCSFESADGRLAWHLLRIDLASGAFCVRGVPGAAQFGADGSVTGVYVRDIAREPRVAAAVNASPYDYARGVFSALRRPVGLYMTDGVLLSAPAARYGAVWFARRDGVWTADVLLSQTGTVPSDAACVFGGFMPVLADGAVLAMSGYSLDSRICVGVDESKTQVFILAAEKPFLRQGGASFEECAYIIAAAGAVRAVQLDGGSSSALYAAGRRIWAARPAHRAANAIVFVSR